MEEEDIDYTKKTSSVLLLPNNSGSSESYYDTNNYKQVDGRNISNERVNIRQLSISKTNSRNKFCWKIYCSPEWRRISKKSIIISFFLFFGGLVSIIRGILAVSLTGNLNIFLSGNIFERPCYLFQEQTVKRVRILNPWFYK